MFFFSLISTLTFPLQKQYFRQVQENKQLLWAGGGEAEGDLEFSAQEEFPHEVTHREPRASSNRRNSPPQNSPCSPMEGMAWELWEFMACMRNSGESGAPNLCQGRGEGAGIYLWAQPHKLPPPFAKSPASLGWFQVVFEHFCASLLLHPRNIWLGIRSCLVLNVPRRGREIKSQGLNHKAWLGCFSIWDTPAVSPQKKDLNINLIPRFISIWIWS